MSTINNTIPIAGDGANNQDSGHGTSTNTNMGLGVNPTTSSANTQQQQQLQQQLQQLSSKNASFTTPQPPILTPTSSSTPIQQSGTALPSASTAASSAIPSAEGTFSTSLPASFLAALVQASNNVPSGQISTSAEHSALQALVRQAQAQAQARAQAGLSTLGSPSHITALPQLQNPQQPTETRTQHSPITSPLTVSSPNVSISIPLSSSAVPGTSSPSQVVNLPTTAVVTQTLPQSQSQPSQQQQQQQQQKQLPAPSSLSASALFLQQQMAAQRAAQALKLQSSTTPQQQQSPSSQRQQQPTTPQQPQQHRLSPVQTQTAQIATPDSSVISTTLSGSPAGVTVSAPKAPMTNSTQLEHDLKQLQLHNQRQAAAAAAAVGPPKTETLSQAPNVSNSIAQLLSASNNKSSSGLGGNTESQGSFQPQPTLSTTPLPGVTTASQRSSEIASFPIGNPSINNGDGPVIISYTGVGAPTEGPGTSRLGTPAGSDTTTSVHNESLVETAPQIFKATYSGVPVFEMICRGVAVMRRRSDSYLNATQILKVAEFDKPQRTRILEREVQKGEHEKVQGGYGKYQGTWVPYDRGVQLCQEYNVLHVLRPLLEYQSSKVNSPPLAPKHITAASTKPRKPREPRNPGAPKIRKSKKGTNQLLPKPGRQGPVMGIIDETNVNADGSLHIFADGDEEMSTSELDDDEPQSRAGSEASMDETMSILSAQSRTPSPIGSRIDLSSSEISDGETFSPGRRRRRRSMERSPRARKKPHSRPGDELFIGYHGNQTKQSSSQQQTGYHSPRITQDTEMSSRDDPHSSSQRQASPRRRRGHGDARNPNSWQESHPSNTGAPTNSLNQGHYAETLLEYFVSDSTTLPSILTHPPSDLDFDLIIDEEGHTPLHWAVAMARTKIVKLLVQHGADIYRVNNQGQTALMRSVLFTNNFDMKTFPSLLEILQKTIFTIDKNDQTVFHHVAVTAGMRGKVHASRYYMECLLEKLAQHPQELASIINVQDVVGDTALIIAARIGNKKVVKLLIDAGADSKIRNKSGRNADEYIQDAENQPSGPPSSTLPPSLQPIAPPTTTAAVGSTGAIHSHSHQHLSQAHHQNIGSGNINTPQRMTLTASQQPQHHPGSMAPSASSIPARMHGHTSPNLHGIPSPNQHSQSSSTMRSITPPPRHGGHTGSSSSNMDRTPNVGYQDYSPSPRNSSQQQSLPPLTSAPAPHFGHRLDPISHPIHIHDPSIIRNPNVMAMSSTSTLTRDTSALAQQLVSNGRPSQRMIPAVTELFEQLTHSYEKDLYEKEQDLLEARNLLHSIQAEIQEGHRTIDELRSKTMYLGQAEEQVRTLEGMIRQEINLRQRLKLENLIVQEETRLNQEKEPEKEKQDAIGAAGTGASFDMERLLKLEKEAGELRLSLTDLQQGRKDQVEQIVQLKSQQGKRRHEYKRLIALCCNVSIDEVDDLLGPLLSTLGNEDGIA